MRRRQGVQLTSGSPAFALSVVFVFVCSILGDVNMNIIMEYALSVSPRHRGVNPVNEVWPETFELIVPE